MIWCEVKGDVISYNVMWSDATWYDVICLIWCSDYCCNVIALILIDIWWYSFDDVMWRLYIFIWCDLCTCWCDVMWLVFIWTDIFSPVERCYTCVLYWYDMFFFSDMMRNNVICFEVYGVLYKLTWLISILY